MRTCSIDGCDKTHRARGLCATHYNQQHQPNRHRKISRTCICCGDPYESSRPDGKFCSYLCRDFTRWGPLSSTWPRSTLRTPREKPQPYAGQHDCAWCGSAFATNRRNRLMCSLECKRKAKQVRRRGREVGAPGTYTWTEVIKLYLLFDRCCAYCMQRTDAPEPDHVVPLSRGGGNSITNILPACQPCNGDKRDLLLHEWAEDRARRGLPARQTEWYLDDPRFQHLTSVILAA